MGNTAKDTLAMKTTNIPVLQAMTMVQTSKNLPVRLVRSEIVGSVTFLPGAPSGPTSVFPLNPLSYPNSNLAAMAKNFNKYRFNSAILSTFTSQGSSVGGGITVAFSENPSYSVDINNGTAEVFALEGAQQAGLWTNLRVNAKFPKETRKMYYYVDPLDREPNTTFQGVFFANQSTPSTATTPITIPIYLSYDVEFIENAQSATGIVPLVWPQTKITARTGAAVTIAVVASEVLALPSFAAGKYYSFDPQFEVAQVDLTGGADDPVFVRVTGISYVSGSAFLLYKSKADYQNGSAIPNLASGTDSPTIGNQNLPRSLLFP